MNNPAHNGSIKRRLKIAIGIQNISVFGKMTPWQRYDNLSPALITCKYLCIRPQSSFLFWSSPLVSLIITYIITCMLYSEQVSLLLLLDLILPNCLYKLYRALSFLCILFRVRTHHFSLDQVSLHPIRSRSPLLFSTSCRTGNGALSFLRTF